MQYSRSVYESSVHKVEYSGPICLTVLAREKFGFDFTIHGGPMVSWSWLTLPWYSDCLYIIASVHKRVAKFQFEDEEIKRMMRLAWIRCNTEVKQ